MCPFIKSVKVLTYHLLVSEFVVDCVRDIYEHTHAYTFFHTSCICKWMGNPAIIFFNISFICVFECWHDVFYFGRFFLGFVILYNGIQQHFFYIAYANEGLNIKSVGL